MNTFSTASYASPKLVTKPTVFDETQDLRQLILTPKVALAELLTGIALGGGTDLLAGRNRSTPIIALPTFLNAGSAGYVYSQNKKRIGEIQFGVTENGDFAFQSSLHLGESSEFLLQIFNQKGDLIQHNTESSAPFFALSLPIIGASLFNPECPILNQLYSILASDYEAASKVSAHSNRVQFIERVLRKIAITRPKLFSIIQFTKDPAYHAIAERIAEIENDPILTWKERHELILEVKTKRSTILKTKARAHHTLPALTLLPMLADDFIQTGRRLVARPFDNFLGIACRVFIDTPKWFFNVVRNNMGYSIAMAIYSPFTFFLVTQPMNPHATWAAGKLRSAYIETTSALHSVFEDEVIEDVVTNENKSNITHSQSLVISSAAAASTVVNDKTLAMPLSSQFPKVDRQNWDERMSNFKAMQMSYESNLEIAPRIGRVEQMENQLNWPLIIDSAWTEADRYLDQIAVQITKKAAPEFTKYLEQERLRTESLQYYLWDRNIRFILDHPFTLMDQSKEQTQYDHYIGRAFIQLHDMTAALQKRGGQLQLPKGYERIEKIAAVFAKEYQASGSILDRLKNNSKVFAQKNSLDSRELREYMKRQWELLYLLENRTQEASNFGLKMYVWSVRNAVYLMQSTLNAKREELRLISPYFTEGAILPVQTLDALKKIDTQFESYFHMLVLEFASLKQELEENLKDDIEAKQRQALIQQMENFLKERDQLLKTAKIL